MSKQCSNCGANHQKLGVYSCKSERCRGEIFYHIYFNDGIKVLYDTRYDSYWEWGIVLDPMDVEYYDENEYIWILTKNGENIINWSRKYDYNFNKLFRAYHVIGYHKKDENNKRIVDHLYSVNLTVNKVLFHGLNFYLITNNRCHNYFYSLNQNNQNPEGGMGMYALVIIQRYWLKTLEAKRHNKKYKNYIYRILKDDVTKNINCLMNIIKYV